MKNTQKLTFSAIMAAISSALMLTGYFPYFTYAVPAVSGLFIMVTFIEAGVYYALGGYVASAVISLIISEKEVAVLYLLLFGFYPIVKAYFEKIKLIWVEWAAKLAVFNAAAMASYGVCVLVMDISFDDLGILGKYGKILFLLICNVAFVLYDIAVSRVAAVYIAKLHKRISSVIK